MTIIIGMIGKDFSMIAVDSRMSDVDPLGKVVIYDDEKSKLHDIGFGWLATTGAKEISEDFAKAIVDNNINSLDSISALYSKVDNEVRKKYDRNFSNIFDKTYTLFSYSYDEENLVKLNIEFIKSYGNRLGISGYNKAVILPQNVSPELVELEERFKPLIEKSSNINELIYHTSDYIEEVSKVNEMVSDICDFGFMFNMDNILVTRKYLRGRAKDLKEICSNGNIEEHFSERIPIIWNLSI